MTMLCNWPTLRREKGPSQGGLDGLEAVMITIRSAAERGPAEFDWLSSRHSFSFGHYCITIRSI